MSAQGLAVGLLVPGCGIYAVWALMPAVARRRLATALGRLPLPEPLAKRLQQVAQASAACGCDGCDRSELKSKTGPVAGAPRPITFHPRVRR